MDTGDLVGDFTLPDETGTQRRLSEFLARGPAVIYFYPAALSLGCTVESCHFRDLAAEFAAVGAQPLGISPDGVSKQQQFADRHSLGFPLLSDQDGRVASQFGVKRRFGPVPVKRWTFVVGRDARVIEVIRSETSMKRHADRALEVVRGVAASSAPMAGGPPGSG